MDDKRLTIEELRNMHGEPVWVDDLKEWAIVEVDQNGIWANIPFVKGLLFNRNVESRKLTCYRYKPVVHGRWEKHKSDRRGYTNEFVCSYCGCVSHMPYLMKECEYEYCPYCSAKMDLEGDC